MVLIHFEPPRRGQPLYKGIYIVPKVSFVRRFDCKDLQQIEHAEAVQQVYVFNLSWQADKYAVSSLLFYFAKWWFTFAHAYKLKWHSQFESELIAEQSKVGNKVGIIHFYGRITTWKRCL